MIMADKSTIGERVKFIRLSLGLSQAEFASRIKSSNRSVSSWERGRSIPTSKALSKIARMAHTSISKLIERDESKLLFIDKETAELLHAALYVVISNDRFLQSNQDDAKRLIDIDKRAKEIMHSE